ncbi:MAG TPA: 2'-5' RNA ligase family protein [Nocardioides sp.]|uniref:2'-5' RNA ligase family protein n=1 Tax=Nocardioides sp. TaxID=35761 RepID=UPI002E3244D6|nr:2'-5' RNA ligase family protein [Nocardioides sp.]HEX3932926.1 2'-5' RNA ligase family protein [Nocardioides sp.]
MSGEDDERPPREGASTIPEATETAVIIPVAPAEMAVSKHRLRFDVAASKGVPAHVTVLFPFVSPVDVDDQVIARLAAVFAAASPFDCTFDRCAWFGDDVLWLAPERDQEFRCLTEQVVEKFPGYLPYGGVHDDVVPHLTVGESRRGTVGDLKAAESDISGKLPIVARIDHALLMAGTDQPDSWRTVARLPLAEPRSVAIAP